MIRTSYEFILLLYNPEERLNANCLGGAWASVIFPVIPGILSHYLNLRWKFACKLVASPHSTSLLVLNLLFKHEVSPKDY